jgi:hypothetical protein
VLNGKELMLKGIIGSGQERDSVLKVQDQLQQRAGDLQERKCCISRCKDLLLPPLHLRLIVLNGNSTSL